MAIAIRAAMIRSLFLMLPLIMSVDIVMAQSVYKCTDSSGKTSYNSAPCVGSTQTKILNEVKPRADAAPSELVAAYKKCLVAIHQNNLPAYYDCFTGQEAQLRRDRHAAMPKDSSLYVTVTPLSGSVDRRAGTGNIVVQTYSGNFDEYLSIDLRYEVGQWKVASIGSAPREKMIATPADAKEFKVCGPHARSCN